jgi:carbonic anhydrase
MKPNTHLNLLSRYRTHEGSPTFAQTMVTKSFVAGPGFWGLINPQWPLCTKGRRQSPINVEPDKLLYDPSLRPVHLDKHKVRVYVHQFPAKTRYADVAETLVSHMGN